jgi:tyrosyl-tRNA synthetase
VIAPTRPEMSSLLRRATPDEQFAEVTRGTVDLHVAEELKAKLRRSYEKEEPLLVKAGFDPSRPDLHLGHTLLLTRMRRFQDFGHRVVFLIGDFTALIGDPSGKNVTRPALSREEVLANAETYKAQVFKVLDGQRTEVRFNSEWIDALGTEGLVRLAGRWPLARMLEREDFKTRFREGKSIALHELLYPLLQGYDSVALKADVELGSSDQLFNLLVGRTLMRELGMEPQVILTGPILEGLDARLEGGRIVGEKMSKSLDNFVGVSEPPEQIFGKLMSVSDDLMWRYLELLSARPLTELTDLRARTTAGTLNPKAVKVGLAEEMVARFHGAEAGRRAAADFDSRFAKKHLDAESLPEVTLPLPAGAAMVPLVRALLDAGLVTSTSEGRRLITQGAVRVDGERASDLKAELGPGVHLVQVGKLRAARLRLG